MILTASDVSSLSTMLSRWEWAEYIAEGFVVLGCLGELVANLGEKWLGERRSKRLERWSTIVLILALMVSLTALVRTNELSGFVIGSLGDRADKADEKARAALEDSANASTEAGEAKSKAEGAKTAADAAETEIKTVQRQVAAVAWRSISPHDIAAIGSRLKKYKDVRVAIATVADNEEAVSFAGDIFAALKAADWPVLGNGPHVLANLGEQKFGVAVSTSRDDPTRKAAYGLRGELARLGFAPTVSEEDSAFNGGGNGMYVFVWLRPRSVPISATHK
jgi:hypothetical protein